MTQKNTTAAPARVFGYVRVSTAKQRKERQIDNIKAAYPNAVIIEEAFTGTSMQRPAWTRLYNKLAQGDTVIFDEVSRMSRNAEEGFSVYEELYNRGVNLVFLKEPGINSDVYRGAAQRRIEAANIATGNNAVDNFTATLFDAINQLLMDLAKQQIAMIGRAAKVHLIACTQSPVAAVIPTPLKCNFDSRLALRTATPQDSRNIIGVNGCEALPDPMREGKAYGYYRQGAETTLYKLPKVEEAELNRIIAHWMNPKNTRKHFFGSARKTA